MGNQIFYMGATAAGHTMKIVSNYLSALSVAATAEAFALAVKAGLDSGAVSEVLKVSSGRNYSTEFKFPRYVLPRKFDDGFRLELYVKDLHLLHDVSEELGVPMPIGQTLRKVYERAKDLGYGPESHTNIVRMVEQDAGVLIGG
jgi:3-hydroxyisobutyrate dehydrogenase-like beta-hydroxyacid dehydrogenase